MVSLFQLPRVRALVIVYTVAGCLFMIIVGLFLMAQQVKQDKDDRKQKPATEQVESQRAQAAPNRGGFFISPTSTLLTHKHLHQPLIQQPQLSL